MVTCVNKCPWQQGGGMRNRKGRIKRGTKGGWGLAWGQILRCALRSHHRILRFFRVCEQALRGLSLYSCTNFTNRESHAKSCDGWFPWKAIFVACSRRGWVRGFSCSFSIVVGDREDDSIYCSMASLQWEVEVAIISTAGLRLCRR